MNDALSIFTTIYNWIKETPIISFTLGEAEISFTMLGVLIGCTVFGITINVIKYIFLE